MTAVVEHPTGQVPVITRRRLLSGPFRALLGGQVASQAADAITTLTLAQVIVFDVGRGATPGAIARTLMVSLLPLALAGPFAGRIADRWDRKRVLSFVGVGKAIAAAAATTVPLTQNATVGYAAFAVLLVGSRIVYTARSAALPHVVSEPELVAADSLSAIAGMIALILGGACAAVLAGPGPVMALATAASLHLGSAVLFNRSTADFGGGTTAGSEADSVVHDLVVGGRELLAHGRVRRAVATVCVHRFLLAAAVVVIALVADSRYNIEAAGYAVALGAVGFGSFLATLVVAPLVRRVGRDWVLVGSFVLAAGFSVGAGAAVSGTQTAAWPSVVGVMFCIGGLGCAFQLARVLTDAVVQGAIPDGSMGRAFAVYDIAYTLAFVSAGLAIVPLWSLVAPAGLLTAIASVYLISATTMMAARTYEGRRAGDRRNSHDTIH